nr:PH domain-containing protein [Clostridia bacterium]
MKFKSKVDWWFYLVAAVLTVIPAVLAVMMITERQPLWLPVCLFIVIDALLVYPSLVGTYYILEENELIVKSGLSTLTKVPYRYIVSVNETRNPLSSPALSLDRLEIRWAGEKKGFVLISPKDKALFMRELNDRMKRSLGSTSAGTVQSTASGRRTVYSAVLGVAVVAAVVVISFMGSVKVTLGDSTLTASAPMAGKTEIAYEDIASVELREEHRAGSRTFGVSTSKMRAGSFSNDEFGGYKLYSYTDAEGYVVIFHSDGVLVVGQKTAEENEALFEALDAK